MWYYNNEIIKSPRAITLGEVTYPKNIFKDKEFLLANGIKSYREEKVDERYYWQGSKTVVETDTEVVATYEAIPRLIDDRLEVNEDGSPMLDESGKQVVTKGLKSNMLAKVKQEQSSKLSEIDWYWLREMKTGIAVPEDIVALAASIYTEAEAKETEIKALATIEDIIAYENPITEEI